MNKNSYVFRIPYYVTYRAWYHQIRNPKLVRLMLPPPPSQNFKMYNFMTSEIFLLMDYMTDDIFLQFKILWKEIRTTYWCRASNFGLYQALMVFRQGWIYNSMKPLFLGLNLLFIRLLQQSRNTETETFSYPVFLKVP